jgi:hypothetical protein
MVEGKRLQVNASATRYQRELAYLFEHPVTRPPTEAAYAAARAKVPPAIPGNRSVRLKDDDRSDYYHCHDDHYVSVSVGPLEHS